MDGAEIGGVLRETLLLTVKLGGPPLLVALVVGLVVSLVQAVTQVNEATLAFLPKVVAVGAALAITGPLMLGSLSDFTRTVMDRMVAVGGK